MTTTTFPHATASPSDSPALDMVRLWTTLKKYRPLALALTRDCDTADDVLADAFLLIVDRHNLPTQPTTTFAVLSIKEAARKARRFWSRHTSIEVLPGFEPPTPTTDGTGSLLPEYNQNGQKTLFTQLPGTSKAGGL